MTPKEKAKKLVNKFRQETDGIAGYNYDSVNVKCALIAVDEILDADWFIPTKEDSVKWSSYWQEVKQEIEKL